MTSQYGPGYVETVSVGYGVPRIIQAGAQDFGQPVALELGAGDADADGDLDVPFPFDFPISWEDAGSSAGAFGQPRVLVLDESEAGVVGYGVPRVRLVGGGG